MKALIFIVLLVFTCKLHVWSQSYCIMSFSYKVTVISDTLHPYKIGFPNTKSLAERDGVDSIDFHTFDLNTQTIRANMSGIGCDYCDNDYVKNRIIKKDRIDLPIQIFCRESDEPITVLVSFAQITFISTGRRDKEAFIIDLGKVKL